MNAARLSFFALFSVLMTVGTATTVHPAPKIRPIPCPYPPIFTTRITETGAKERIVLPCPTPDPCFWPPVHTQEISQASISYPPRCCPILYQRVSARSIVPYPLPLPCRTPFPLPTKIPLPTKKPECAPCKSGSECLQGKCWGSPLRCTDGDYQGLLRCGYKRECAPCSSGLQCATMKCWKKKCVFNTHKSKKKCFYD